jgi:selenocysteine lyase/cysteine desulfurase
MAERLDREFDVLARPGLHCAPEVHRILGTEESGALRFSVGWCSTPADVERALTGVEALSARAAVRAS